MCLPHNENINFHIRWFNAQENVSYVIDIYVSADVLFMHFGELKSNFFTSLHIALRGMYKKISGVRSLEIV